MGSAVVAMAAGLLACTLLQLLGPWHRLFEVLSSLPLQMAVAGLVLLPSCLLARGRRRVAGLVLCLPSLVVNGVILAPFLAPEAPEPPGGGRIRVLTLNVWMTNGEHQAVIDMVRREDPDVAVFVETDAIWRDVLTTGLAGRLPHRFGIARPDHFGMFIFTRAPHLETWTDTRAAVPVIAVRIAHPPLWVFGLHPPPPIAADMAAHRDTQLRAVAARVAGLAGPVVVAGDLNVTPFSARFAEFLSIAGLEDPRRRLGLLPSWIAGWPWALRIPIDHVLAGAGARVNNLRLGPPIGSDHLPLIADVAIP